MEINAMENQTCPAVGYQAASVCVPVTVVVSGRDTCEGVKNGTCSFTISQNICVAVPVAFGAVATVGESYVNCKGATAEDVCTDCAGIPPVTEPVVPDPMVPGVDA